MGFSVLPKGFFCVCCGGFTGVTVIDELGEELVELKSEARKGFDELLAGDDIKDIELLLGKVSGSSRAGPVVLADWFAIDILMTLFSWAMAELVRLVTILPALFDMEFGGMTILIFFGIPPSVKEVARGLPVWARRALAVLAGNLKHSLRLPPTILGTIDTLDWLGSFGLNND